MEYSILLQRKKKKRGIAKCNKLTSLSNILPDNAMFDILSRLPVKSLLRFKCVSKLWNKLLSKDCAFANMHLTRSMQQKTFKEKLIIKDDSEQLYLLNYQQPPHHFVALNHPKQRHCLDHSSTTTIVGSCNGLLCTMRGHYHNRRVSSLYSSVYIWNPYTSEYHTIPHHKVTPKVEGHDLRCLRPDNGMFYGFGYSHVVHDYEVVRITYIPRPAGEETRYSSMVDIYSLRGDLWRSIADIPYDVFKPTYSATFVSGCLHWPAIAPKVSPVVISFQIGSNEFTKVPLLSQLKTTRKNIIEFQGKLGIVVRDKPKGPYGYDLWVMENYGVLESWTKLYNIGPQYVNYVDVHDIIVCSTKNGMLLIRRDYHANYAVYDPTNSSYTHIQGISTRGTVVSTVESIVGVDVT